MADSFITASSRRLAFFLTLFGVPLLLLMGIFSLRISTLECQVETQSCPSDLTSKLETLKGKWLLTGESQLQSYLTTSTNSYHLLKLERELPGTLRLHLQKQSTAYQLRPQQSPEVRVISQAGLTIETAPDSQLPTLILNPPLWQDFWAEGKPNSLYHQKFLHLMSELQLSTLSIKGLYLADHQTVAVYLTNGQVALLDLDELKTNLERLRLVERNLTLQPQPEILELDLRYQLPALRTTLSVPRHEAL